MAVGQYIHNIDDKIMKVRKIVDNWEEAKTEIGEKDIIKFISKTLASIDFDVLPLLRDLNLPSGEFMSKRQPIDKTGL